MTTRTTFTCQIVSTFLVLGFASSLWAKPTAVDAETLNMLRLVQDPDGHSNVRRSASLNAPVIGKVTSGAPVFMMETPKSGFHQVFIDKAMGTSDGFVHASRLKPITNWKAFSHDESPGVVKHKGFEAVVKSARFVTSEHRVTRDAHGMVQVNGKSPWGQDGGMPQHVLLLEVSLNGKKIELPLDATDNLYEPSLGSLVLLTPGDPSRQAILTMCNGDGAGGYYVAWGFENGNYRGRSVMYP